MGQLFGILIFFLIAYFIRKSILSISIAFILVLFSILGTVYDTKSHMIDPNKYNEAIGILVIDVLLFFIFIYLVRNNNSKTKIY